MEHIPQSEVYSRVHKVVRAALADLVAQVGRTDAREAQTALEQSLTVFGLLNLHAEVEERFFLPLLEDKMATSVPEDHAEHVALEAQQQELEDWCKHALAHGATAEEWYSYYIHLTRYSANYFLHLYREETETAPLFTRHTTEGERRSTSAAVNRFTTQEQKVLVAQTGFRAWSPVETAEFLQLLSFGDPKLHRVLADAYQQVAGHAALSCTA